MTDRQLQENVQKALDWDPSVESAAIGVSVDRGVVTLRGDARSYAEKAAAERVALAVYGVQAVANDLEVKLAASRQRSDTDLAKAAVDALRWSATVPDEKISVAVSNGWVTLKGKVDWDYQRLAAGRIVRDLTGVRSVSNNITVEPHVSAADISAKIEDALKRSAAVDARRISVSATDGTVILSGNVHSWFEKDQARRAAWSAPGVKQVNDRLAIVP